MAADETLSKGSAQRAVDAHLGRAKTAKAEPKKIEPKKTDAETDEVKKTDAEPKKVPKQAVFMDTACLPTADLIGLIMHCSVIMLVGIPGSGKSTFGDHLVQALAARGIPAEKHERDTHMEGKNPSNKTHSKQATEAVRLAARGCISKGHKLVLSSCHTYIHHRTRVLADLLDPSVSDCKRVLMLNISHPLKKCIEDVGKRASHPNFPTNKKFQESLVCKFFGEAVGFTTSEKNRYNTVRATRAQLQEVLKALESPVPVSSVDAGRD
jgi:predicted kinase